MQTMPLPSVLVIDDEPDNFDVIDTFLGEQEYQLNYASSGQEALKLLDTFNPDVILLDVMMPNMSGIDVCKILKADPKWQHVPIIIVTSLTSKEDLSRCLNAGADDFISKPVNSTELRSRLQSMLRIKQQYDNVQSLLQLREDMVNMILHDLRNPIADAGLQPIHTLATQPTITNSLSTFCDRACSCDRPQESQRFFISISSNN